MPTILDLTLDTEIKKSGKKLQADIEKSLNKATLTLKTELERRGYYSIETKKKESDLSLSDDYDIIMKNALNSFRSLTPHNYDSIQYTLPQAIDKIIENTEDGRNFHVDTIHYVLFLQIESHIADNGVLKAPQSESFIRIRIELVDIRQSEILTYKQKTLHGRNIMDTEELSDMLSELLEFVPFNIRPTIQSETQAKPKITQPKTEKIVTEEKTTLPNEIKPPLPPAEAKPAPETPEAPESK